MGLSVSAVASLQTRIFELQKELDSLKQEEAPRHMPGGFSLIRLWKLSESSEAGAVSYGLGTPGWSQ